MRTTPIDEDWFATVDRFGKVGSRHHVIPKFILERWADANDRVWAKSKHDQIEGVRNIRDLGITDFYTYLAVDDLLDSTMEELLSVIEGRAAAVLAELNSGFRPLSQLTPEQYYHLVTFVAYQAARSPRRRREHELLADFYGKTVSAGRMATEQLALAELAKLEFIPHQNEHLQMLGTMAVPIAENLMGRPMCLVTIDRPLFTIGDEAVIINTAQHIQHHEDCGMSDAEFAQKLKRERRKKRKRQRDVARLLHVYPTQPRGIEQAVEIVMPISPRTLLLFGPSGLEWNGHVERDRLMGEDASHLAARINEAIATHSLDVIVGRLDDNEFQQAPIPDRTQLLTVCGATGAADAAVNSVPLRLRPRRLDRSANSR